MVAISIALPHSVFRFPLSQQCLAVFSLTVNGTQSGERALYGIVGLYCLDIFDWQQRLEKKTNEGVTKQRTARKGAPFSHPTIERCVRVDRVVQWRKHKMGSRCRPAPQRSAVQPIAKKSTGVNKKEENFLLKYWRTRK